MKNLTATLAALFSLFLLQSVNAQVNTYPYVEDFESEGQGSTACGATVPLNGLWTNQLNDDIDWTSDQDGTGSSNTGPTANGGADHNPGVAGGTYLYVEASACALDTAKLLSPEFQNTAGMQNITFEFWYHQFGADINAMYVNVRNVNNGNPGPWVGLDTLFTPAPGIDQWNQGLYDLSAFIGDTFQIQIVGITGTSFGSDLAIDDMRVYQLLPNDAGVIAINNIFNPITPGVSNVDVTIQNFGFDTLFTADIGWSVDGAVQTPFAWSDTLDFQQTDGPITIGSFNFPAGLYSLKSWTENPNGVIDNANGNDTTEIFLCTPLAGTYTVGGAGADFADLSILGDALSQCGISDDVIVTVNPGTYTGRMILDHVAGTSDTSTIVINGVDASLVSLTNNQLSNIYLNGTDYTTIKNMTLINTGAQDVYGVQLRDTASFNVLDSLVIILPIQAGIADAHGISASDSEISGFSEGQNALWTTVSNCHISGGDMGIHFEGENALRTVGNVFVNNIIEDVDDYGFYMDDQDSITITGNVIRNVNQAGGDGIYCFDLQMFNISGNELTDIPDWGLYIADGNFALDGTPTSRGLISNNMISSTSDYGMYLDDIEQTDIFHNTIVGGTSNPAFRINDFTGLNIRNNIFVSQNNFAFRSDEAVTATPNALDYNIYWTPAGNANFVQDGPTPQADLLSWQTAVPTLNINSIESEPIFVNGTTDLHMIGATANDVGDNSVGILIDIDGDTRPNGVNVDIGADEFLPLSDDAVGIEVFSATGCGDSLTPVYMVINNLGANSINGIPMTVETSGAASDTLNFTYLDTLSFNEIDTVLVGTINTYAGGTVSMYGWTSWPGDQNTANDTTGFFSTNFIPFEPAGIDVISCGLDSAWVYADGSFPASYAWYDSLTGGNQVGLGDSLFIPSIAAQDTYYVQYINNQDSLATPLNSNNGAGGNMFDLVAITTVTVTGLAIDLDPGVADLEIWYRTGTWVGNDVNQNNDWVQVGQALGVTSAGGPGVVTQIPIPMSVTVPAGQTYAFYVAETSAGNLTNYTNGTAVGNVAASNANLQILEGCGKSVGAFSGSTFQPRIFNGVVYLGTDACSTIRTPVTATTVPAPTTDLGVDTTVCAPLFTLDAGNPGADFIWNDSTMNQTLIADTAGLYWVTVTDSNGCVATDTIDLVVNPLSVDLTPPSAELCAGDTLTLTPVVTNNYPYAFNWNTGDTVASINATTTGTYIFNVWDPLGCDASDTTVLTVNEFPVAGFNDVLNTNVLDLTSTATNADSTVYDFGDGSGLVSMTNASHTYAANGTYTVCQYVYNDCGTDTLCTQVIVSQIGLEELASELTKVYPNPTSDVLNIETMGYQASKLELLSVDGKLIAEVTPDAPKTQLDVSKLQPGVYLVRITESNFAAVKQFVKE
jgi:hypothetical protein